MALLLARQVDQATATAAAIASKVTDLTSAESGAANVANTALGTANTAATTANNVVSTVNDVKHTFSSWDNCMSQAYCKWPVIVGIVVGSLIILSVLYCVGRCLCCGAECVCCCFRCCAGGCGGGGKKNKYEKDAYPRPPQPYPYNAQYQSPATPMYGANPAFGAAAAPRAQFATFESTPKAVHEDSLPAMPSWENANSKKVEVYEDPVEAHEMNDLGTGHGRDLASAQPMLPHSTLSPATTPGRFDPPVGGAVGAAGAGGYGFPNQSTASLGHQDNYRGTTASPMSGYNAPQRLQPQSNGSYHGSSTGAAGVYNPYHSPRNPSSPLYSSGGSTAYDPPYNDHNQRSNSPYAAVNGQRNQSQTWGSQPQGYSQSQSYGQNQSRGDGYGSRSPYGASRQEQYASSQQGYGNAGGYGGQQIGRKAAPGSWRDI